MESSLIGKALVFGPREYGFESHDSKMTPFNPLVHFLNHFRFAVSKKSLYFDVEIFPRSLQLLKLFYKLNIIRTYKKSRTNLYRVYPSYSIYRNRTRVIKSYFRSSHYLTVPLSLLRVANINRPYSFIVLETHKGIITHKEALKLNISGRIIMHIN